MNADAAEQDAQGAASSMSVEEMIEGSLGRMNWAQFLQAILASIPLLFDNQQTFISVFTDAEPPWHCSSSIKNTTRNKHMSIISEWNLECSSSFIKGLPATSFFVGSLLGGYLLSSLGDSSLGRKNLLFFSCLTMSLSALASAFSPNIWVYSVLRFISGFGRVSIAVCTLVLLSERVGKHWRGQIIMLGYISLTIGLLSLTAIGYLTRHHSWRALYLWTSVPAAICCTALHFFLYESPRWFFLQGRPVDAVSILKKLGSVEHLNEAKMPAIIKPNKGNAFSSLKIIAKKSRAIQRLTVSMILSFGVGMTYYGMFLGVGGLGFNIYLSLTFNAVLFLIAAVLTFGFWIQNCNRRSSVVAFCAVSGAASVLSIVGGKRHKGIQVGLELTALFCACMVIDLSFMYVVELFPTCIRNTAGALSRQAMLLASIFVPVLLLVGSNGIFFHAVFGVTIFLSGLLVLSLPETRGKVLCDTMEEQEVRDKNTGCTSC